jgi:uncharacterized protein (UPF0332 family)
LTNKKIEAAKANLKSYLEEGLLKKESNETARSMYLKNSDLSLRVAEKLMKDELKPYLWVIVCSYYSMFYAANAVLLHFGYRTTDRNVHGVTNDALIALVLDKLNKGTIEDYEETRADALEIASARAESVIEMYERERSKRGRFQYNMDEEIKEQKAATSIERAKSFTFEMKKLMA